MLSFLWCPCRRDEHTRRLRVGQDQGHLWRRIYGELQLALLSVVDRKALHQQRREARASPSAEGMEDEEALQSGTLVSQLPHAVQYDVDQFLADSVVTTCVVVSRVFFARDELLRVKQLTIRSGTHLVCKQFRVDWWFVTDVSVRPVGPAFKGQASFLSQNFDNQLPIYTA